MSGWIFGISSLLCALCFCVVIGFWFSRGFENIRMGFYWLIPTCIFLSAAVLSGYWYYVVKPARGASERKFAVAAEHKFLRKNREIDAAGFWLLHAPQGVQTLSPIPVAVHVRYTNLQPVASMIDRYTVEAQGSNNEWVRLSRIDGRYGVIYWATNLNDAVRVAMVDGPFDLLLQNKNIQPNETVRGWIFLEIPPNVTIGDDPTWRFSVKDMLGVESTGPMPQLKKIEGEEGPVQGMGLFQPIPPKQDLSALPRRFYTGTRSR
jgi:hypothetical protein